MARVLGDLCNVDYHWLGHEGFCPRPDICFLRASMIEPSHCGQIKTVVLFENRRVYDSINRNNYFRTRP